MSMMTNTLLQNVETRLRQIENDTNEPYHYKLVILVGDHAQLSAICHCHLSDTKNYCQKIMFIIWLESCNVSYFGNFNKMLKIQNIYLFEHNSLSNTNIKRNFISFEQLLHWWKYSRTIHWWQNNNTLHTSKWHWLLQWFDYSQEFPVDQIYVIQLETNAKNVEHIQSWVNNKRFN
jgi:hypothetical protein